MASFDSGAFDTGAFDTGAFQFLTIEPGGGTVVGAYGVRVTMKSDPLALRCKITAASDSPLAARCIIVDLKGMSVRFGKYLAARVRTISD